MGLVELFIVAVGLSMDAFAVSICKGLSLGKIKFTLVRVPPGMDAENEYPLK